MLVAFGVRDHGSYAVNLHADKGLIWLAVATPVIPLRDEYPGAKFQVDEVGKALVSRIDWVAS